MRVECKMRGKHITKIFFVLLLLGLGVNGRRARGRGRTKSRVQIGLPVTGKYRDPESDQYYNNNNVSSVIFQPK